MSRKAEFESLEQRTLLSFTAPSSLEATPTSSKAVQLTWVDNADSETGFRIDRSLDGVTFNKVNIIGPNQTSYVNGKLKTGTTYYYRVRALQGEKKSAYTEVVSVVPRPVPAASASPVAGLEAPTNFKVTPVSPTGIKLTWTDNASIEAGYRVERSVDGTNFKPLNTIGPNETVYRNGKLTTGQKYWYRVGVMDGSKVVAWSQVGKGTPKPHPVVNVPAGLSAPAPVQIIPVSSTAIVLRWTDNATSETGYKLERSTDGQTFRPLNQIGANETTYRNGNLTPGTLYYYRIAAFNPSSSGEWSKVVKGTVKIPPAPPPPPPPASLVAANEVKTQALSSHSVRITWADNSVSEQGYKIERGTSEKNLVQIAVLPADATSYVDTGLQGSKKYYWRVRPFNDHEGNGPYSNIMGRTTLKPGATPDWASGGTGEYATGNWWYDGVSVTLAADPDMVIPILKQLHIGSVRLWFNRNESWEPTGGDGIPHAKKYKEAGFRVLMVVGDDTVPTPEQAKAFFEYVRDVPNALQSVDLWEIGNEPNIPKFWKGTAEEYVNNVLKPAWDVFSAVGEPVVGAGPSWDVNYAKRLVDAGYLNYVDYADFHPYGSSPEEVYKRAVGARDAFAGKPILFTEWNIRNTPAREEWAAEVDQARKLLATVGADSSFYFTLVVAETLAGAAGLINLADYSPNQPFFDMFKKWGDEPITEPPVTG